MRSLTLLAAAVAAGLAAAACPNSCSGHGTCGTNDICTCYQNWQGPDCSLRTCAFGDSWALDAANPHSYEECSGAGLCDRATGECKCFPGYSGFSCQRRSCPNECSGHGSCRLLGEIDTIVPYNPSNWDSERIQACVCDSGYFGTDCSSRRCPTGDDPLTLCASNTNGMVQEIKLTLGSRLDYDPTTAVAGAYPVVGNGEGMDVFGTSDSMSFYTLQEREDSAQLHVGARDSWGQLFYAPTSAKAVLARATSARSVADGPDPGTDNLEVALENIPGQKVRNVQVSSDFTSASNGGVSRVLQKRFLVTFMPNEQNSANFGVQQTLVCDSGYGCGTSGCAPIVKMPFLYRYAASAAQQSTIDVSPVLPTAPSFRFFTGASNTQADFAAGSFIRLDPTSMPRLPPGVAVDGGVSTSSPDRYDIRIVVVIQDPVDPLNQDNGVDVYWTKVVFGNTNITTDTFEYVAGTGTAGVFSASKAANFAGTLNGFTYRGFIPTTLTASIPDAPGVTLRFPATNMVSLEQYYRFFEILVKLPTCDVTPLLTGTEFASIGGAPLVPVDSSVENIECSNRGQCNRETGMCECFEGYYGVACHRQTILV